MSLDDKATKPHLRLAQALAPEMQAMDSLIRDRMRSEHAPASPKLPHI